MELTWQGNLRTMVVEQADPIIYRLRDAIEQRSEQVPEFEVNQWLGMDLSLRFTGLINCVFCGRKIRKTYGQGLCFQCFQSRPEADSCIIKPELCHYFDSNNPCRDENFAKNYCFQPHILYASLTSGVKVGITRATNLPRRWIDQGAIAAIRLAEVPSRREVGKIEHRLSTSGINDKTHWASMLKGNIPDIDLEKTSMEMVAKLMSWGVTGILSRKDRVVSSFTYPVVKYPTRVKSLNLDKTPRYEDRLMGIKGQYMIFENSVLNVRKFSGYKVRFLAKKPTLC